MKRLELLLLALGLCFAAAQAQIGYQVAIINQQTGAPRANENVSITTTITDSAGEIICTETHDASTNEVGIATIKIGTSETFANVDWKKLPLWITATVGSVTIASSQILNVPVAEHAKHYGVVTYEDMRGRTYLRSYEGGSYFKFSFNSNGTVRYVSFDKPGSEYNIDTVVPYEIEGNQIIVLYKDVYFAFYYSQARDTLYKVED